MTLTDFNYDHPDRDVAAIKRAIANKLIYAIGKDPVTARPEDWLHAAALAAWLDYLGIGARNTPRLDYFTN